jgi:DNA polymerase-3 subunit beta
MRLSLPRQDLTRLLTAVTKVVEARSTIPILGNVLLSVQDGQFSARATDLDIEVSTSIPVLDATNGSTTVNAKLLADIAKRAAGDVSLELADGTLTVKSGRSRFKLATLPVEDFPSFSAGDFTASFDVDLAALVAPCAFAISTEETRYYLNGVYFHTAEGRLAAVATDGHRLSRHYGDPLDHFDGVILPRKLVSILPKGNVHVSLSTTKVRIATQDTVITSKLIDGTFPDYQRVIPTANDKIVLASIADLRSAVERVSTVATERGRAVKLDIAPGQIGLSVRGDAEATDVVEADYSGEPIEIGFNAAYISELLANLAGDTVRIALNDGGSPTIFTGGDDGVLVVLRPMRVS